MKSARSTADSHSPSHRVFHQVGKCVSASDTVLPKALQKASHGHSGPQTRQDRQAGRFVTLFSKSP